MLREAGCEFCLKIDRVDGDNSNPYDFHVLASESNCHIVLALGALAPGHLLIVTDDHRRAISTFSQEEITAIAELVDRWSIRLNSIWGQNVVVFEHGASTLAGGGGCIMHAHLQLIPWDDGRRLHRPEMTPIPRLTALSERFPEGGYLLFGVGDQLWAMRDAGATAQHFRRVICQAQGRPEEWDYLVFPQFATMDETLKSLTGQFH